MKEIIKITVVYIAVLLIIFLYQTKILQLQILSIILIIIFIIVLKRIEKEGFIINVLSDDLKTNLFSLFTGIMIVIPLYILYLIVYDKHFVFNLFKINYPATSLMIIIIIGEELFFRGYILNKLQKKINNNIAVLISSLYFFIYEIIALFLFTKSLDFISLFLITFLGSIIIGYHFIYTKSILGSMSAHITWKILITGGIFKKIPEWFF